VESHKNKCRTTHAPRNSVICTLQHHSAK